MDGVANLSNFSLNEPDISELLRVPLDDYHISIKIIYSIIGIIFMIFGIIALIALNRTRQTPSTARFLSSGLLTFDILTVGCYTVRKFVTHHEANIMLQISGTALCYMAYVTVGLMSLERMVIFFSPHFYLRHVTPSRLKKLVIMIWVSAMVAYCLARFGACYLQHPGFKMYDVITTCNPTTFLFYGSVIVSTVLVSLICYLKIFMIINSENKNTNQGKTFSTTAKFLHSYKSTSLVLAYIITIAVTSLAYGVVILLQLSTVPLRLANDAVTTFNCIMDPCMYILWYRECRMEMLKMMSCCIPSLSAHIERMRIKIFDIVTVEKIHEFRANRVHPLHDNTAEVQRY